MDRVQKLRELASWYREYAEEAGEPVIWLGRLRTAESLEREAGILEIHPDASTSLPRLIGED